MCYRHGTSVGEAAVLRSDGDGGFALTNGGNDAVLYYDGDIGIFTAPSHIFVGGIVGLYCGVQGIAFAHNKGQSIKGQRYASDFIFIGHITAWSPV